MRGGGGTAVGRAGLAAYPTSKFALNVLTPSASMNTTASSSAASSASLAAESTSAIAHPAAPGVDSQAYIDAEAKAISASLRLHNSAPLRGLIIEVASLRSERDMLNRDKVALAQQLEAEKDLRRHLQKHMGLPPISPRAVNGAPTPERVAHSLQHSASVPTLHQRQRSDDSPPVARPSHSKRSSAELASLPQPNPRHLSGELAAPLSTHQKKLSGEHAASSAAAAAAIDSNDSTPTRLHPLTLLHKHKHTSSMPLLDGGGSAMSGAPTPLTDLGGGTQSATTSPTQAGQHGSKPAGLALLKAKAKARAMEAALASSAPKVEEEKSLLSHATGMYPLSPDNDDTSATYWLSLAKKEQQQDSPVGKGAAHQGRAPQRVGAVHAVGDEVPSSRSPSHSRQRNGGSLGGGASVNGHEPRATGGTSTTSTVVGTGAGVRRQQRLKRRKLKKPAQPPIEQGPYYSRIDELLQQASADNAAQQATAAAVTTSNPHTDDEGFTSVMDQSLSFSQDEEAFLEPPQRIHIHAPTHSGSKHTPARTNTHTKQERSYSIASDDMDPVSPQSAAPLSVSVRPVGGMGASISADNTPQRKTTRQPTTASVLTPLPTRGVVERELIPDPAAAAPKKSASPGAAPSVAAPSVPAQLAAGSALPQLRSHMLKRTKATPPSIGAPRLLAPDPSTSGGMAHLSAATQARLAGLDGRGESKASLHGSGLAFVHGGGAVAPHTATVTAAHHTFNPSRAQQHHLPRSLPNTIVQQQQGATMASSRLYSNSPDSRRPPTG